MRDYRRQRYDDFISQLVLNWLFNQLKTLLEYSNYFKVYNQFQSLYNEIHGLAFNKRGLKNVLFLNQFLIKCI
jgi:hypothetical protein